MAGNGARLTRDAYNRLEAELTELKVQRVQVREDIREAREQGDLRENYAYHEAKDRQGMIEGRIGNLEARLGDAEILEEGQGLDEVVLGVPVQIRALETGKERVYTIVSEEDMDSFDDAASENSPIGAALLRKKVGDKVEVQGPRGAVGFEIIGIG